MSRKLYQAVAEGIRRTRDLSPLAWLSSWWAIWSVLTLGAWWLCTFIGAPAVVPWMAAGVGFVIAAINSGGSSSN